MFNFKNLIKIFLILVFTFAVSYFFEKNIFLADSPKIRPNLDTYFLAKINNVKENVLARLNLGSLLPQFNQGSNNNLVNKGSNNNLVANQSREETINFLKTTLKPITKGVSAATKDQYSYTEFKINEIEWAEITYTLKSGKIITVRYPKGIQPPPQTIYEGQYE